MSQPTGCRYQLSCDVVDDPPTLLGLHGILMTAEEGIAARMMKLLEEVECRLALAFFGKVLVE
jgi:hypothetical protein